MNTQLTELTGIVRVENTDKPIYKLDIDVRELPESYPDDIAEPYLLAWQPNHDLVGWIFDSMLSWEYKGLWRGWSPLWYLIPLSDPRNRPILQHLGVMAEDGVKAIEPATVMPEQDPAFAIMPERIWKEARVIEICQAILRRNKYGKPADREWLDELGRLNDWLEGGER